MFKSYESLGSLCVILKNMATKPLFMILKDDTLVALTKKALIGCMVRKELLWRMELGEGWNPASFFPCRCFRAEF